MGKIIHLMGKSSSGKDTVYKWLLEEEHLGIKPIVQYTTRPIRSGEAEGREYHFVTQEELEKLDKAGSALSKMILHYATWNKQRY